MDTSLTWMRSLDPGVKDWNRITVFEKILSSFKPCTLVDLGAKRGLFSLSAMRLGFDVTAVEVDKQHIPDNNNYIFLHDDALNIDLSQYELIACLGLFYHLSWEQQVTLVQNMEGVPVILDTGFAETARDKVGGKWEGELRRATTSSKINTPQPFMHTVPSLSRLFGSFMVSMILVRLEAPNRAFFIMSPK